MYTFSAFLVLLLFLPAGVFTAQAANQEGQTAIEHAIAQTLRDKAATVGVAYSVDGRLFTHNDTVRYPLMSVFKLHVAVAALQRMEAEGIGLNDMRQIAPLQMHRNTYSPLLDRYPSGPFSISYADLLHYALALSDNNACDILIDYTGGIEAVKSCIDRAGITGYDLTETEASMHADLRACYRNWAHPSSVVRLLQKILDGSLLDEEHTRFMRTTLIATTTGSDKMRAGLPADLTLGHKTGSSDRIDGVKTGDNDAGFFYLPDGRLCFLAVFVKDSRESDRTNAALIARITRIVYDSVSSSLRHKSSLLSTRLPEGATSRAE